MATFTTAQYDLQKTDRANISRLATPNVASGTVEFAVIKYTLAGTEAANDIIKLCVLPAGCIPLPQLSSCIANTDPSAGTLTLDIGTAEDPDGWANDILMATGAHALATSGTFPAWVEPTAIAADTGSGNAVVYATVAAASASPDAGDILYFTLAYKRGR